MRDSTSIHRNRLLTVFLRLLILALRQPEGLTCFEEAYYYAVQVSHYISQRLYLIMKMLLNATVRFG